MNFSEQMDFNRANRKAVQFIEAATEDYVSCRCCLINGLFTGMVLGAQAIEKYLKAFALFKDPTLSEKRYNHQIKALVSLVSDQEPKIEPVQFGDLFDRLESYYKTRYPGTAGAATEMSTGEMDRIDRFVLHLYDLLPIPEEAKFGNYGYFCLVFLSKDGTISPYEEWLKLKNTALQGAWSSLESRYDAARRSV